MRSRCALLAALLSVMVPLEAARGFSPACHRNINDAVLLEFGFDCHARQAVNWANWQADLPVLDASEEYDPRQHFARPDGVPVEESWTTFNESVAFVRDLRDSRLLPAIADTAADARGRAYKALGQILHALGDLFAHSNLCDAPSSGDADVQEALWLLASDGAMSGGVAERFRTACAGLQLVGCFTRSCCLGCGSSYDHCDHNKDDCGSGDPAHACAVVNAHVAARNFLADLRGRVPASRWNDLLRDPRRPCD